MSVDADGKVLVSASFYSDAVSTDALLERFTATGSPDATFGGGDGMTRFALNPGDNTAGPIFIGSDGRITVGLDSLARGNLVRFNPDGTFDSSFGDSGIVVPVNPSFVSVGAITVDHNGNLLAIPLYE